MKEKKTRNVVVAVILAMLVLMAVVIFVLFAGVGVPHTTTGTDGSNGPKNVNGLVTEDLKVGFSYGCDNHVKYNRYAQLTFHVENTGDDLAGKMQVSVPVDYNEGVVYEKEFDIAAGEDKNIKMYIPTNMVENRLVVSVKDSKDSLIGKFNAGLNYQASRKILNIGVITEEESAVGYMASSESHIYYMLPEELADDERGLDMLDVIVIDEVASGAFTDAQVEALIQWVKKGGSLVLGTGAAAGKSLEAFSGNLLSGTIGETQTYETLFGYEVSDEESYLQECYTNKREEKVEKARTFLENAINDTEYAYYIQHYEPPFRQYSPVKDGDEPDEEYFLGWNGEEDMEKGMDAAMLDVIWMLLEDYSLEELRENMSITLTAKEMKEIEKEAEANWDVKPLSIQHVDLQLEDGTILLKDADRVLMQKVDYGNGNVIVAQFGLNLPNRVWTSIGADLRDVITSHISKTKMKQLEREEEEGSYYDSYYTNLARLGMDRSDSIPNVRVYIVILGIYVLLIGPVLYLICKKKDKRHLLWGMIPACSVLFSLFIYFIGSSTRISDTFINYITCTVLDDEGWLEDTSYIGIISPSNKSYRLDVKKDIVVEFCSEDGYYYYSSGYSGYEPPNYVTLEEHPDKTTVKVSNKAAFSPTYLQLNSKKTYEKGIDVDVSYTDYQLLGTITNNLGYDLERAILVNGDWVYTIGSLKKGEVLDVSTLQEAEYKDDYLYGASGIDSDIWDYDRSWEERASFSAFCEYLVKENYGQYVMGIAKEAPEESAVADLGYEATGVNLIVRPFEMEATVDGRQMLMDINDGSISSVLNGNTEDKYMYSEIVEMYYVFNADVQVDQLVYISQDNGNISSNGSFPSSGIISLYNPATADYDVIFDSGDDEKVMLAPYLDDSNGIRIRYEVPQQVVDSTSVCLPTLSATYDIKKDAGRSASSTSR